MNTKSQNDSKTEIFKNPVQEQQNIRWVMVLIFLLYLTGHYFFTDHERIYHMPVFWLVVSLASMSVLIQLSIKFSVNSDVLKTLAIVGDVGLLTVTLILGSAQTAIFYPVYLWVIVGNSVRYGNFYLKLSSLVSILGFGTVILVNQFWRGHLEISIGLLIGLAVVPFYLSQLLDRLNNALDEAVTANKAKSQFLANISHELRTPLTGIIASADLLVEEPMSNSGHRKLEMIRDSAQSQMALINDLLDLSKAESGKTQENKQVASLETILEHVNSVMLPQAEAKGIDYQAEVQPEMMQQAWLYPQSLQQILINLVGNAIKFTPEGSVTLQTQSLVDKGGNHLWRFDVIDTGIGISQEAMETIFDPFVQADESVTRKYGGTGLGTAISKQLVEMMGGQLRCQSTMGSGSCFSFEIPVQLIENEDVLMTEAENTDNILNTGNQRIKVTPPIEVLVADDNQTNRDILEMILIKEGHNVTLVTNGLEALEALQDYQNFDLVILDRNMPELDGLEVMKLFKENTAGLTTKQPKFMLITADGTEETRELALQSGVDSFMTKPVRPRDLNAAIDALFIIVGIKTKEEPEVVIDSTLKLAVDNTSDQSIIVDSDDQSLILDLHQLEELETLSPGLPGQMIAGFFHDGDRLIQAFTEACGTRDYAQILDIAHALKGSALQLGIVRLADYCKNLKKLKRTELDQKADTLKKEMKYLYTEARNSLLAYHQEEKKSQTN